MSEFETVPEPEPTGPAGAGTASPREVEALGGAAAEGPAGSAAGLISAAFDRGMAAAATARGAARQAARRRQRGGTMTAGAMALIAAVAVAVVGTAGALRSAAGHPAVAIGRLQAARPQADPSVASAASLPTPGVGVLRIWHGDVEERAVPSPAPAASTPVPAASPPPQSAPAPRVGPAPAGVLPARKAARPAVRTLTAPGGPVAVLSPQTVDFGTVAVGSSVRRRVTLTNTGTAELHVGWVVLVDAQDVDSPDARGCMQTTVAPGRSCSFTLIFRPTRPEKLGGPIPPQLSVSDDADGGRQSIALRGSAA